jgi:diguanylate cyclase (GGDEF)-like protein
MAFRCIWRRSSWWRRTLMALLPLLLALGSLGTAQAHSSGSEWNVPALYWLDPSGTAPLEAARAAFDAGSGRTANQDQVMPLAHGAAVWYRLQLPPVTIPMLTILEVPFAGMDKVDLFRPDEIGGWYVQHAGDALPVNAWSQPYLHPAFYLTIHPQEGLPTLLRVQHSQDIRVRWTLRDISSFSTVSELWHMALGAYAGFMFLVVLLSIIQTATWRDSIHLYYAVHVVLIGLSVLSIAGLSGEYLWPDQPWWNDKAPLVLPALSLGWMGLFVRELVAERGQRWVSWVLLLNVGAGLVMAVGFMLNGRASFYAVPSVYTIPSVILILAVLAWYALRRPQVGLWVLAGWTALAIGSMLPMLRNLGVLPVSFFTQYGLQIGAALEVPLVLAGLYLRSRERRDNMVRLGALARTDPLTGVANHRVLATRLDDLLRRARREPMVGAVMQVHVINLESIRTDYGREAAEAALLQATDCLVREASESDTVARERGGDLVLLLDGKVSREHVANAGRNIIARGLKFSGRLPPQVTLSLRVAAFCAPLPHTDAAGLLARLGRALQDMGKERPPRALRILAEAAPPEQEFDAIDSIAEPE